MNFKTIAYLAFLLCSFAFVPVSRQGNSPSTVLVLQSHDQDGSSFDNAVVIQETSESTGVAAEYKWLRENYRGYKMRSQSLSYHNGKPYDVLHIKYKRKKKDVYFDISNFFGKF